MLSSIFVCFDLHFPNGQWCSALFHGLRLFATPWTAAWTPGFPVHHQLLELTQTRVHPVSDTIQCFILCHPLFLPSIFPSIRVFSSESVLRIRWPKYWSFSFGISPFNEYSGLLSFRIDWFDIFAVQGTLKSRLQYHSSKSINSSALSFLYGSTLISVHDYWKSHSFDEMDFCQQSDVSAF